MTARTVRRPPAAGFLARLAALLAVGAVSVPLAAPTASAAVASLAPATPPLAALRASSGPPAGTAAAPPAATAPAPPAVPASRAASARQAARLSPTEVRQAQQRLVEMGYWVERPTGAWDGTWRQPLIAFQKATWRKRTGVLTRSEWSEILRAEPLMPRETGTAHIEVDLTRQIFYMVDAAGAVSHVLTVSSGSGKPFRAPSGWRSNADTPCGHLAVYQRGFGWHKSELGEMYNPLYIVGGIAIHGSLDVPPRPVSHGCIRIPMYAARHLPGLVPKDTPVLVYGCPDEPPPQTPAAARR